MKNFTELPDWTDLRFFLELARQRSQTAAARTLGVTHATVGRRLKSLQETLGQTLLLRRGDGYVLTDQGRRILEYVGEMEDLALAISRYAANSDMRVAGTVSVTMTQPVATHLIIPCLPDLRRRHPELELDILVEQRNLSLTRREADVALRHAPPRSKLEVAHDLGEFAYYFYASASYLQRRKGLPLEFVCYSQSAPNLPEVRYSRDVTRESAVLFRGNSLEARIAAIKSGQGAGLLPRFVAEGYGELHRVDVDSPGLRRPLFMLVHRDLKDAPRIRAAMRFIRETMTAARSRLV